MLQLQLQHNIPSPLPTNDQLQSVHKESPIHTTCSKEDNQPMTQKPIQTPQHLKFLMHQEGQN